MLYLQEQSFFPAHLHSHSTAYTPRTTLCTQHALHRVFIEHLAVESNKFYDSSLVEISGYDFERKQLLSQ
jgi:hypothetical protein